ncbi:MAG: DUF2460 domain-containing protein [Bryobacteraceae bacterium]
MRRVEYRNEVLRFLDGSEQRYRQARGPLKQWVLNFGAIEDEEARRLVNFFEGQQGRVGSFAFEDPWEKTTNPNCSLVNDEVRLELENEGRARVRVVIRENPS